MSLLRAAATVSSLTLLSRFTGLARDIVIARLFGASGLTDAFWVAFRIPNLMRRLFAEGAFSQAFIPILGEVRQTHPDHEGVQQFVDRVAKILFTTLTLVTLLGIIAAPLVVMAMASGMMGEARQDAFEAATWMTRLMFPYIICMSLVAFASGILNTYKRFAVPAFTPVLLNLSMIGASFLLVPHLSQPIYALAIGVMIGGLAQLGVQWWALSHLKLRPRLARTSLRESWNDSMVRRVIRQMIPATIGVSVAQISLLINTNIATWLTPGSVTWLSFADRLMEFPTALIGVALGTVLLPTLSRANASQDDQHYSALLDWGLRLVFLLGLPAALCMILLADGMVATLFQYGAFTARDVAQTQTAVMAYSAGLIGLLLVKILAPGFYGRQDIRTPVKIAIGVLVITQLFNVVLVPWLDHAGLALAIGLGACTNALALFIGLRKRGIYRPSQGWLLFLLRQIFALIVMGWILQLVGAQVDWTSDTISVWMRAAWLMLTLSSGGLAYLIILFALGVRPKDFYRQPQANKTAQTT
ncbi:murein biosynthesis integral membrane protein MurJ [Orrella sp. 11846]|uniref:murein biosynthesis integral membrane protein MurJ n=1 Tax=Orrella sp. 11846 TaxID=3409913 RepID=UPI003B5C7B12